MSSQKESSIFHSKEFARPEKACQHPVYYTRSQAVSQNASATEMRPGFLHESYSVVSSVLGSATARKRQSPKSRHGRSGWKRVHLVQKTLRLGRARTSEDRSSRRGDLPTKSSRAVSLGTSSAGIRTVSLFQQLSKETAGCHWQCKMKTLSLASFS